MNAEGHETSAPRRDGRALDGGVERVDILDRVVRRHYQHQRVGSALGDPQRRYGRRRCGIAPDGLEQQPARFNADPAQLLGNDEAVLLVGDDELVKVARPLASVRPDDAITLLELNIEFNPRSAKSYALMGFAYTRKFDDESAIAHVQKAVDLEPENGEFQGQLAQLKMFQRKR